jgi:hypothetical protein
LIPNEEIGVTEIGAAAASGGYGAERGRPTAPGPTTSGPGPATMMTVTVRAQEPVVVVPHPAASLPAAAARADGPLGGVAGPDWRPFLRALASEVDAVAGTAGRDALLRGVGLQLARMYPLPARDSLDGLAMEMTETLGGLGWGSVGIAFSPAEHCLVLTHEGLPRIGGAGDPPGTWLGGVLVGLYEGWMAQQPGTDSSLVARRIAAAKPGEIVIRYGKE